MIERLVNKILKSLNNLPAEYKVALARILTGIIESIITLDKEKVDKEEGKELSSNDFTDELKDKVESIDELKDKLDGIEEGAQKNVNPDWNATEGDALILNKPSFDEYPNAAEWDHINHKIIFKHNGTELPDMEVDGADFVKDGMIENIEIVDDNLVITFNTDHGHEPISIPLSEIFNPENYYTKEDINNRIYTKEQSNNKFVEKVTGKQLSTEDFTTELKEKLENIKANTQVILITNNEGNYGNASYSLKEFINNVNSIKELNFLFLLHVNNVNRDNVYRTFTNGRFIAIPYTKTDSEDANYKYITLICDIYGEAYEQKSDYDKEYDRGTGFICSNQFIINIRYNNNVVQYKTTLPKGTNYGTSSLNNFRYYYDYLHIKALLGQITSYTNEQIEQLIAEGNQVEIFKLDITEDKTLLQQILTDNSEDGDVDITSVMYFVYDSTKQKYYDVNSIIIETVESDRQINIVAANDRYDYTAVKINTAEAAYIINPSHVESANADWNENDEDKASYVKNRTHWKEKNKYYNTILAGGIDIPDGESITLSDMELNDAINVIKQHPDNHFNIQLPYDTDDYGGNIELRMWFDDYRKKLYIGQDDTGIYKEINSIEEGLLLFTIIKDNKYYYNKDSVITIIDDRGYGELTFYDRFSGSSFYNVFDEYIYHKLDKNYLPEITVKLEKDWQENDNSSDKYIENRTHWKEPNPNYNTVHNAVIDGISYLHININELIPLLRSAISFIVELYSYKASFSEEYFRIYGNNNNISIGDSDNHQYDKHLNDLDEALSYCTDIINSKYILKNSNINYVSDSGYDATFIVDDLDDKIFIKEFIYKLDSAYLEDLTESEINEILE